MASIKNEIKYALYILTLGISLTVYAHQNFATKTEVRETRDIIKTEVKDLKRTLRIIDKRIYEIHKFLKP